jgi:hypothetical protein
MVLLRVSQCTEFALRDQRIFALEMHLVGTDSVQFRTLSVTSGFSMPLNLLVKRDLSD